jgi:replicative DNA helicase
VNTETLNAETVSRDLAKRVRERMADPRKVWGIPWGLAGLDNLTGGIHEEEMTVMMARPGCGKTAFLGQTALGVAQYLITDDGRQRYPRKVVKLVLCEMSAQSFQQRLICQKAGVSMRRVREGRLTQTQLALYDEAAEDIAKLPIMYLDNPTSLESTAKWLREDPKPAWWAVDYIGIHPLGPSVGNESAWARVSKLSAGFRWLCKEVAPGLILAQMNRECEKREDTRPKLSDLRDSGSLEQDAWNVMGLWREDVFARVADEDRNRPKPASLFMLKQRNGPTGTVELLWTPNRMTFVDITKVVEEAEDDGLRPSA